MDLNNINTILTGVESIAAVVSAIVAVISAVRAHKYASIAKNLIYNETLRLHDNAHLQQGQIQNNYITNDASKIQEIAITEAQKVTAGATSKLASHIPKMEFVGADLHVLTPQYKSHNISNSEKD